MIGNAAPLKVLVVDDEPAIRRFLRTSLTAQGYQVIEAEDGHRRAGASAAQTRSIFWSSISACPISMGSRSSSAYGTKDRRCRSSFCRAAPTKRAK